MRKREKKTCNINLPDKNFNCLLYIYIYIYNLLITLPGITVFHKLYCTGFGNVSVSNQ
jgi:hypothetical protein